jgi:hypothetical protein
MFDVLKDARFSATPAKQDHLTWRRRLSMVRWLAMCVCVAVVLVAA